MSGNCLGKIGSRELLRAVRSSPPSSPPGTPELFRMAASDKRILRIDMDGCNVTYLDDTFDRNNASGNYHLDVCYLLLLPASHYPQLSNTYGYAVACILYELANTKADAKFVKVQHGFKVSSSSCLHSFSFRILHMKPPILQRSTSSLNQSTIGKMLVSREGHHKLKFQDKCGLLS